MHSSWGLTTLAGSLLFERVGPLWSSVLRLVARLPALRRLPQRLRTAAHAA